MVRRPWLLPRGFVLDCSAKRSSENATAEQAIQVSQALLELNKASAVQFNAIQSALAAVRDSTADSLISTTQIYASEQKAGYEAAKGSGADYFVDPVTGEVTALPVNTVLRRQFDITKIRYERALKDAKYLAFIAKLAIEQRIGIRMASLTKSIGPLDPPAQWHADVCSLKGIDYEKLRTATPSVDVAGSSGSGGTSSVSPEDQAIDDLADQYIGDYVTKLANFVDYYNLEFPSHDGDDLAILSFRDDLMGPSSGCIVDSPNLLYYSGRMDESDQVEDTQTDAVLRGWSSPTCSPDGSECLSVQSSLSVSNLVTGTNGGSPSSPTNPGLVTSSWLHDVTLSVTSGMVTAQTDPLPPRTVSQAVTLSPGQNYTLSWFDQARASDGGPWDLTVGEPLGYRAGVYDVNGVVVPDSAWVDPASTEYDDDDATTANDASTPANQVWGARRTRTFHVDSAGTYFVVFSASLDQGSGSVLLASVQLEQQATPTAYVDNNSSLKMVSSTCAGARTAGDVQKAFTHKCDGNSCYYELAAPITLDTIAGTQPGSNLANKIAAGNFNYRDVSLALNMVGTGLLDCTASGTSSCYGSGYLEYTLEHDAFAVGVSNWQSEGNLDTTQHFNFGIATINHGKALAAERFLTNPISSSDQSLISQLAMEKQELRGRPLDGVYKLRIWDKPELKWNRLEDIQLVVKYRYWSKVLYGQPGSGGG